MNARSGALFLAAVIIAGCQGGFEGAGQTVDSAVDSGAGEMPFSGMIDAVPDASPDGQGLEPPRVYNAGSRVLGRVVDFEFVVPDGMRATTVSGDPSRYEIFNRDTDRHDGFVFMNVGYFGSFSPDRVNANGVEYTMQQVDEPSGTYWAAMFQRRGDRTAVVHLDDRRAFDQLVDSCRWTGGGL
jgi:hypothetical protein